MNALLRSFSLALALSTFVACNPTVIGGEGAGSGTGASTTSSSGGGGSPACPPPTPGLCSPTPCDNGVEQTGGAVCEGGQWVCETASCSSGCSGSTFLYCSGGTVTTSCCPAGDPCAPPPPYCDLGNGTCTVGECPVEVDAGACAAGSISTAGYDVSCTADNDCAAVYAGTLCGACLCPNATVNQGAAAAYNAVIAAADPSPPACLCPVYGEATCIGGTCTMVGGL